MKTLSQRLLEVSEALPKWAWEYHSLAYGSEHDLGATFYGDDGDTITVTIQRCDGGTFNFGFMRSGLSESGFSKTELEKVLTIAAILGKAVR